MGLITAFLELTLFLLALFLLRRHLSRPTHPPFPPGPSGLPIIHNLLDWPNTNQWVVLTEWAQQYGDIIRASIAGTNMVVLNTVEAATQVLQGKAHNYSDRAPIYSVGELVGWDRTAFMMNDGVELKESRRQLAQEIGSRAASARFEDMICERVRRLLIRLLNDKNGENLYRHIHTLSASILLDITYGYDVRSEQDELAVLARQVLEDLSAAVRPGASPVDIFPWLQRLPSWFPGTGYRLTITQQKRGLSEFRDIPFEFTRKNMHLSASVRHSFVGSHIYDKELTSEQEDSIKHTATVMYAAGADTTGSVIHFFFLCMTRYPDVQARAREELDHVVGPHRLPTLADRAQLPYLNALVCEVLRFGSVAPLGLPHRSREDDVHEGWFIPKDSLVIANIWSMSRDPRNYKNPEAFDPTRFMGAQPELDPELYYFGFGRRVCPGRIFADQVLFLSFATVLATMNVTKATDAQGAEITPPIVFNTESITMRVEQFPCIITPRSTQAEALLKLDTNEGDHL